MHYLSDVMPHGGGRCVAADYHTPEKIIVFDHPGQVRWSYGPAASGSGNAQPPVPNPAAAHGNYLVSDDMNDRVVVIDPRSRRIVWQYGTTGRAAWTPTT